MANQMAYRGPTASTVQADGGLGRHALGVRPGDPLFRWRRLMAQRSLRTMNVAVVGDSISFGSGATGADGRAGFNNTFAVRLGQMINGVPYGTNIAGDADLFDVGSGYHVRAARNTSAPDPWTRSTSPADTLIARGTGGQSTGLPFSGSSASISYKAKSSTGFLVVFEDGVGAVAPRVQVTGATGKAVLSQVMTMNSGLGQYARSTFGTILPRGTYTITLSNGTAAGTAVVDGVYVFDGDANSGVTVTNHAFPGNTTDTFVSATTQTTTLKASLNAILNPDLIIINIGANDYMNGVTPATFQTNVGTMIDSFRTQVGNANCPILLCAYFARYDITSPAFPWSQYVAALRAVAAAKVEVEFLDLQPFFQATQTADDADYNLIDTGGVHLANRGHNLYAQIVADRLLAPISIT